MPITTKTVSKKTNTKPSTKSYQMRLTITPEIYEDILKARKKYRYLDDVEIIKIFIGRGADLDSLDDLDYISSSKWNSTASENAFKNSEDASKWLDSLKNE
jgi:hypothetical protein